MQPTKEGYKKPLPEKPVRAFSMAETVGFEGSASPGRVPRIPNWGRGDCMIFVALRVAPVGSHPTVP